MEKSNFCHIKNKVLTYSIGIKLHSTQSQGIRFEEFKALKVRMCKNKVFPLSAVMW